MSAAGIPRIAVIGGGPAGLRAAEVAAGLGVRVTLFDAKPSVGRKFLVAGKSGLNITNNADLETFNSAYYGTGIPQKLWKDLLINFNNAALRDWAQELGVETFASSSGKVFPSSKKAAPLLRRWVLKMRSSGIEFEMKYRLQSFKRSSNHEQIQLILENHNGTLIKPKYDAIILALGGASWPQTGSDGRWTRMMDEHEIEMVPLKADNCGWECSWSKETLELAEGHPLQNLRIQSGDTSLLGELMVTRYGFEGTPIYSLGRELREQEQPEILIDFKPTFTIERLVAKMESARRNFFKEAGLRWKLSRTAIAIIRQLYGEPESAQQLAEITKCCRIQLKRPRPVPEAISTAGGIAWSELDENLMLKKEPGVFCAGEMIDWNAPTGGFLLQGCFSTGTHVGKKAATFAHGQIT